MIFTHLFFFTLQNPFYTVMSSNKILQKRKADFIKNETSQFSADGGCASWYAYQVFLKTGSWKKAHRAQFHSTLENDFAREEKRYLESIHQSRSFDFYPEESQDVGYYDEDYEDYCRDFNEDIEVDVDTSDEETPVEDDYFSS